MLLESFMHERNGFVTLTYSPESMPPDGSLVPRDAVLFMKRLRRRLEPIKFRYFLVGEYGEESWRPHYHFASFGIGREAEQDIATCWGKGYVHIGDLTVKSAAYIGGYVTKKMTFKDDPRLEGRHPEFARMSRNPGIGNKAVEAIAAALNDREGVKSIGREGDVPGVLRHGGKLMPLGRYLKEKLREALGFDEKTLPEAKFLEWMEEMRVVQEAAKVAGTSYRKALIEEQKIRNTEAKHKVWRKKGSV